MLNFALDLDPDQKKPPTFYLADVPVADPNSPFAQKGSSEDSVMGNIVGFLNLKCGYSIKVLLLGNMFID